MLQQVLILLLEFANPVVNLRPTLALWRRRTLPLVLTLSRGLSLPLPLTELVLTCLGGKAAKCKKD